MATDDDGLTTKQARRTAMIDGDFPGGNIIVHRVEGNDVHLSPDQRDSSRWWFYWYFRARAAGGRTLTFHFEGNDPIGVLGPACSTDGGLSWRWMGAKAAKDGSFRYHLDPRVGEARFCFAIPYLEGNLQAFLKHWAGNTALAVGELCRSSKGRTVEYLRAGRLDGQAPLRVLLTARHHACEMMASYALEGMIQAMLAGTQDGRWFRRNVELLAIPFVDKDGVQDGDQGKLRRPRDHNRDYGGQSIHHSVRAIRELVPAWSGGRLRVALDLHCPWIRGPHNDVIYMVGSRHPGMWGEQCIFGAILESMARDTLPYRASDNLPFGQAWNKEEEGRDRSFSDWARDLDGMKLSTTFEIPYAMAAGKVVNPGSARAFGRDLASALRRYLQAKDH